MAETLGTKTAGRWWEYYVLRYFVGTIVGAIAIVFLSNLSGSPMNGSGFPAIHDLSNLGIKEVTALGALGFGYCYIASAPMLVLHATRAQLALLTRATGVGGYPGGARTGAESVSDSPLARGGGVRWARSQLWYAKLSNGPGYVKR